MVKKWTFLQQIATPGYHNKTMWPAWWLKFDNLKILIFQGLYQNKAEILEKREKIGDFQELQGYKKKKKKKNLKRLQGFPWPVDTLAMAKIIYFIIIRVSNMASGEEEPPDASLNKFYKCRPNVRVGAVVCIVCGNFFHTSEIVTKYIAGNPIHKSVVSSSATHLLCAKTILTS